MLAWALAADTPTIIAKTLSPPIKARFIILPPFGQEHATIFIGSITGNKIKEASACRTRISRYVGGKIRINGGAVRTCEGPPPAGHASGQEDLATGVARKREPTTARPCNMGRLPLSEQAARESIPLVVAALSLAARLPGRRPGDLPARVRNAEAAVARNHLLHAHREGWDGAILVHGPSGDFRQCAPRHLVGLACTRIEGDGRCNGRRNEHDPYGSH